MAGEHELLLHQILDRLDRDIGAAQSAGTLGDPGGQRAGRGGIVPAATGSALRIAVSILAVFHGTTSPPRRISLSVPACAPLGAAGAARVTTSALAIS